MKTFICVLLFSWFLISTCGQQIERRKDTLREEISITISDGPVIPIEGGTKTMSFYDSLGNSMTLMNDSLLTIEGDTIYIIKYIMNEYFSLQDKYIQCEKRFDTAKYIYKERKRNQLHW